MEVAGEHENVTISRFGEAGEALDQSLGRSVGAEGDERMAVGRERLQVDLRDRPQLAVAQQVRARRPLPRVGEASLVRLFTERRLLELFCPRHYRGEPLVVAQAHPRPNLRISDGRP